VVKAIYSKYRKKIIFTFVMASLVSLSIIPYPLVMRLFIDTVIPNKNMNEIVMWSGVLLVIVLIRILANFFQNYTLSVVEGNFERDLKITIFEKILKLPMAFFVKNDTGSLMSRVLTDSANSTGLFRDYYIVLYSSILSIAASLAAMFWLDWFLTLMCFLVLPVLFVVTVIMNSKMAIESQKLSGVYADCSKELNQSLSAVETVKVDHLYSKVNANFKRMVNKLLNLNIAINKYGALAGGIMTGIVSLAPILVFIIGTLRVIDGHTSIGTVVAISSLMIYLFLPLQEIALARIKMQKPKAMWEKISDLLNEQEEDLSGQMTNEMIINMEAVQFAYDTQNHIFENMNFNVKSGESIAIVGKTGSGKSTLYKLLAKFYPLENGHFTVGNMDSTKLSTGSLRKRMAYINRNTYIFNGTVQDNIVLNGKRSNEMIEKALKIACLNDEFTPDSVVGSEGKAISDGQRVRLAIARAVIKQPELFMIDEALTALDPSTEKKILKNLKEAFPKATVMIITHRDTILEALDRVFVLHDKRFSDGMSVKELYENKEFKTLFMYSDN